VNVLLLHNKLDILLAWKHTFVYFSETKTGYKLKAVLINQIRHKTALVWYW